MWIYHAVLARHLRVVGGEVSAVSETDAWAGALAGSRVNVIGPQNYSSLSTPSLTSIRKTSHSTTMPSLRFPLQDSILEICCVPISNLQQAPMIAMRHVEQKLIPPVLVELSLLRMSVHPFNVCSTWSFKLQMTCRVSVIANSIY